MFRMLYTLLVAFALNFSVQSAEIPLGGGMRVGDFSATIGEEETRLMRDYRGFVFEEKLWVPKKSDREGYVKLNHRDHYAIRLASSYPGNCDAKIEIDGKEIGVFRVRSDSALVIERGVIDRGKFTFLTKGSREYYDARLDRIPSSQRGLIKITFYPEQIDHIRNRPYYSQPGKITSLGPEDYRSGGTGVMGVSDQRFTRAEPILRDRNKTVVIYLRLVEERIQYQNHNYEIRPLEGYRSSNYPMPVER